MAETNGHHNRPYQHHKLDLHVQRACDEYTRDHPKSRAFSENAARYFPGGSTRASLQMTPFTLTFAFGEGSTLTDVDGYVYADFLNEYTAGIYGHSNPRIKEAIRTALDGGWNLGGHSVYEAQLAKRVCERFEPAMESVRFTNSGTEANTFAIATAIAHFADSNPQRRRILVFDGAYHGGTLNFPKGTLKDKGLLNIPHEFVVAPFDDIDGTAAILQSKSLDPAHTLAAMLLEPMQGNAGARVASTSFLSFLRAECDRLGAFLIFDEVQTARLGPNGLGARLGIRPDLITVGKWVGGGMTFGAFGGRKHLMQQFGHNGKLRHAGTFNNNVVSMAAGCAGLDVLTTAELERVNERGDRLREGLVKAFAELSGIEYRERGVLTVVDGSHVNDQVPVYVTGIGSILSVNFRGHDADTLRTLFWHAMLKAGFYISPRAYVVLSIESTDEQVQGFVQAAEAWVQWCNEAFSAKGW